MSSTNEILQGDLAILEAMASEMQPYIMSDVLFWRMEKGNMPRLTFGGYLMRQHRLLALRNLLTRAEQDRLRVAVDQFEGATMAWTVRIEQRIHQEARARLRQWGEYLRDLRESSGASASYGASVNARLMLTHLVDYLYSPGFIIEPGVESELNVLDKRLSTIGEDGDFIWPPEWMPAYRREKFWYLYWVM